LGATENAAVVKALLADLVERGPAPRAVVPDIVLHSPKITRTLTTSWFAHRVDERYGQCLRRRSA